MAICGVPSVKRDQILYDHNPVLSVKIAQNSVPKEVRDRNWPLIVVCCCRRIVEHLKLNDLPQSAVVVFVDTEAARQIIQSQTVWMVLVVPQ